MKILNKNLAFLIKKAGTNGTALAKATGVPQPTIHRIISGESDDPRSATLIPLAEYFGCSAEALRSIDIEKMYEKYPEETMLKFMESLKDENNAASNIAFLAPLVKKMKEVPVVGTVEGGTDGYLEEAEHPEEYGDLVIEYPGKGKDVYALRVKGESMRPRIRAGEFIIIEPHTKALSADDVIVVFNDGRRMLRELLYTRDGDVTLGSVNSNTPPISISSYHLKELHYVAAIIPRGTAYRAD